MITNRRMLLTGAGALALAPLAQAQTPTPPAGPPTQAVMQQRLLDTAKQNLYPMSFDGSRFSGPGWDLLQKETAAAEFVLFGEEHGMNETPILAKELFLSLRPHLSIPVACVSEKETSQTPLKLGQQWVQLHSEHADAGIGLVREREEAVAKRRPRTRSDDDECEHAGIGRAGRRDGCGGG